MYLTFLILVVVVFGVGAFLIHVRPLRTVGVILLAVSAVITVIGPMAFALPARYAAFLLWEVIHILGVVVGGLFLLYFRLRETDTGESQSVGYVIGTAFTVGWGLGLIIFRKLMNI